MRRSKFRCFVLALVLLTCSVGYMMYLLMVLHPTTDQIADIVDQVQKKPNINVNRLSSGQAHKFNINNAVYVSSTLRSVHKDVPPGIEAPLGKIQIEDNLTGVKGQDFRNKSHKGIKVLNKTSESLGVLKNKTKIGELFQIIRPAKSSAKEAIFHDNVLKLGLTKETVEEYMSYLAKSVASVTGAEHFHTHAQSFIKDGRSYVDKSLQVSPGSCACNGTQCVCCAFIRVSRLKLDNKLCVAMSYIPRPKEPVVNLNFQLSGVTILNQTVSAFKPQEVCLGGVPSFTEVCTRFTDTTVRMPSHDDTVTSVHSCIAFDLNLFMKTVAVFPAGCFVLISTSPLKESLMVNKAGNLFMP